MAKEYMFETAGDLGRQQMDFLTNLLDAPTTQWLEGTDLQPGQRCLDIGAGGGTVSAWLAGKVGPSGKVLAVDLVTDYLEEQPGVDVLQHDITQGVPEGGPFDLIHARLLLVHLSQREEILKFLVDSLAPGGWLVLGEYGTRLPYAMSADTQEDKELFNHIMNISHTKVGPARGQSLEWANQVPGHMDAAGLVNVEAFEYSLTTNGGGDGCRYHRNLNIQAAPGLLQCGATEDELKRYNDLMLDPKFRAWFYQFICTRGQKPA